jgi:hypothetical protein
MNINKAVDKAFETKSFKDLAESPVSALQGLSEGDSELLLKAFNVKSVRDLANLKYVKWAQAIVTLSETEQ